MGTCRRRRPCRTQTHPSKWRAAAPLVLATRVRVWAPATDGFCTHDRVVSYICATRVEESAVWVPQEVRLADKECVGARSSGADGAASPHAGPATPILTHTHTHTLCEYDAPRMPATTHWYDTRPSLVRSWVLRRCARLLPHRRRAAAGAPRAAHVGVHHRGPQAARAAQGGGIRRC